MFAFVHQAVHLLCKRLDLWLGSFVEGVTQGRDFGPDPELGASKDDDVDHAVLLGLRFYAVRRPSARAMACGRPSDASWTPSPPRTAQTSSKLLDMPLIKSKTL